MSGSPSGSAAAAAAAKKAEAMYFEEYEKLTAVGAQYAKYYAAGIVGLVALFALANWISILFSTFGSRSNGFSKACAAVSRPIRRLSNGVGMGGLPLLPGRTVVTIVYWAIMAVLLFTNNNFTNRVFVAKRFGWMTLCNICLTIVLALKNTPLSPLAGRSYESLNKFHRLVGYTTIVLAITHASLFISGLYIEDKVVYLQQPGQYAAGAAVISLICIGVSGTRFIRKSQYEAFFIIHVLLVIGILITLLLHVSQINWSAMAIIIISACLWFSDRLIRLCRWIYYGYGNYCTLYPLPEGATRVVMNRPIRAHPGSHAFLYIPAVRALQTHPFTLVSNDPAQFVIHSQDGFTKALHNLAVRSPKQRCRAAIEGPYGNVPNVNDFDKTVLIGGGSGATFTMSLAMAWLKQDRASNDRRMLDFVWSVKTTEHLDWFDVELNELLRSESVNLQINVTAEASRKMTTSSESSTPGMASDSESEQEKGLAGALQNAGKTSLLRVVQYGRPDVDDLVQRAVADAPQDGRVLVAGAGPSGMLRALRTAAASRITTSNPGISIHLEEFDW